MLDQTQPDQEPPASKGFWSLQSNEESVARGQNNFWAMLETTLAIIGFWFVSLTYETFFPLYTSLFIAPLLFLRSEESLKLSLEWFDGGIFSRKLPEEPDTRATAEEKLNRRWIRIGAGIGLAIGVAAGYPSAKQFLTGHVGGGLFGSALYFP